MGADLSANAVFQPPHMRRMYWPFRGQVRSHKIQFLQWFTGCLIRADLSANAAFQPLHTRPDVPAFSRTNGTPPGPLPQNRVSSVGCRLFDKRRLAGDAVDAVCQETASSFIAGKPQWITRG
ncbi:hypothetical protein EZZ81_02170 [Pseudomonas viridiflava]|uniref:Uncharacterized protein n=1 Tax=Pseudomonas viridiflava TaxID=33069 RepID=A0AA46VU69_PSEVI|nr:hypothetical protein EZZ81_02170 [Pseudomonas viridiflava]